MNKPNKGHGFTLIELMVTVTIAVILITLAAPAFTDMIRNNRMTAQANDLLSILAYTRSEAVKRGTIVYACVETNGSGWTAKVSLASGCGTLLRLADYSDTTVTLNADHTISYNAVGRPDGGHDFILLHDPCEAGMNHRREIKAEATGRGYVNDTDASRACP